jgi:hypothetical protein
MVEKKFRGFAREAKTHAKGLHRRKAMARKKDEPAERVSTDDENSIPNDPDEFRLEMARRIYSFLGEWRRCPLALCKRVRACRGRRLACADRAAKPTPAQTARVMAEVHRLVQRRLAEVENEPAPRPPARRSAR